MNWKLKVEYAKQKSVGTGKKQCILENKMCQGTVKEHGVREMVSSLWLNSEQGQEGVGLEQV